MVGVGNGAGEIGQFMISHVSSELRRKHEVALVRQYYESLIAAGVSRNDYTFEQVYHDYVHGAVGRWLWFLAWMADAMPTSVLVFFGKQVYDFIVDNNLTLESVPQPRV